tara:strand:- start:85 stop:366 length:282 start_codon:yes stop_codon:yes gene_type:complete
MKEGRLKELVQDGSLEVIDETDEVTIYEGKKVNFVKCTQQKLRIVEGEPTQVKFYGCVLPTRLRNVELDNGEIVKMKFHQDCKEGLIIKQPKN